jgi:hypothetical protein
MRNAFMKRRHELRQWLRLGQPAPVIEFVVARTDEESSFERRSITYGQSSSTFARRRLKPSTNSRSPYSYSTVPPSIGPRPSLRTSRTNVRRERGRRGRIPFENLSTMPTALQQSSALKGLKKTDD